jgi:uncharacterized protein YprB with RNaseH-like and TPR domain
MQIGTETFLQLVEDTGKLCFWDSEATGLRGDYNSLLCVSIKPFGKHAKTFAVKQPGNDQRVAREAAEELQKYLCWCTYYGSMFDVKLLNTRLTKWGHLPVEPRHHIDLYFKLKTHLLTARKSQAHLLRFLGCAEKKMDMDPGAWNDVIADPKRHMKEMIARCESDCAGLEALYVKTKHLIREVRCA